MTNSEGIGLSAGAEAQPSRAPRPLRIIVADDDRDAVLTLVMVLRHEGHEAWGFHRGWDAVHAVRNIDPDVVLLDIRIPDLSGWEAAKEIRKRYGKRRPFLIGISGFYKGGSDRVLSELSGFDHYLTKPYEPSAVLRLIEPLRSPGAGA